MASTRLLDLSIQFYDLALNWVQQLTPKFKNNNQSDRVLSASV